MRFFAVPFHESSTHESAIDTSHNSHNFITEAVCGNTWKFLEDVSPRTWWCLSFSTFIVFTTYDTASQGSFPFLWIHLVHATWKWIKKILHPRNKKNPSSTAFIKMDEKIPRPWMTSLSTFFICLGVKKILHFGWWVLYIASTFFNRGEKSKSIPDGWKILWLQGVEEKK